MTVYHYLSIHTVFITDEEPVKEAMDIKLFLLMVTAFCCGSIKNSMNQPEPLSNNLAKDVGNRRASIKYPQVYDVAKYNKVGYDDESSMSDRDKGIYTYIRYITINIMFLGNRLKLY